MMDKSKACPASWMRAANMGWSYEDWQKERASVDLKEKLARALCWTLEDDMCHCGHPDNCKTDVADWDDTHPSPSKILEALVKQGLAIVPLEPTEEMRVAGDSRLSEVHPHQRPGCRVVYKAMLKAAEG